MWRKDEPNNKPQDNKPQTSPDPPPARVPVEERPAVVEPSSPQAQVNLSRAIRIKGEVSGQGDLFWDGVLEGKIHITDGNFTVGRNAHINASIEAREIIVHGDVNGALKGDRVQVMSTGKVTGDVETRGIVIEDGAVLRSRVQVLRDDEPQEKTRKAAPPQAKAAAASASAGQPQAKDQSTGA